MQFFKRYQREISTLILVSLLQSFVFEVFVAYAKPLPFAASASFYAPIQSLDGSEESSSAKGTPKQEQIYALDPADFSSAEQEAEQTQAATTLAEAPAYTAHPTSTRTVAGTTVLYGADIPYGVIGVDATMPYDDPEDNLFKVNLSDAIDLAATYVLSYDLYGASSAAEVAKSINTTTSMGGYAQGKSPKWTRVEEYISASNLKSGTNTVLFTADIQAKSHYIVRNLQIEKRLNAQNTPRIQVNGVVRDSLTGNVYVSGIVPADQGVELFISGKRIPLANQSFEYVQKAAIVNEEPVVVELKKNGDLLASQAISLEPTQSVSQLKALTAAFDRRDFAVQKTAESNVFTAGKVGIKVPSGSFKEDFTLSIQELRSSDYAPTGMAMVNVTQGNAAYRFLPDGTQFDQEVELTLPYDASALPRGYSVKDIQVFYFDTQVKQWQKVKVIAVLEDSNQVVALTNHFTDYLAGVIQEPESPDSSAFAPTTLSGIQAVNPTKNIPMVSVPQINDRGDAALQFPLILPQGRHGMTPDISVNYNSSSDEGDFGLGWSLSVPTISVDTRWGVPLYDSAKETESYLFNGEELLLVKGDNTLYAPHKDVLMNRQANATFKKMQHNPNQEIKRLGSVNNYTWEVLDHSTGWTYAYTTYSKGKWYLTKVTDLFSNSMEYGYNQNASGDYQLNNIVYNKHPLLGTRGSILHEFTIKIVRKNTIDSPAGPRRDVKVNNRFGVEAKSVDLIDKIIISMEPKASQMDSEEGRYVSLGYAYNEYKFLYKAGKFGRTLLYKIINSNSNNSDYIGNNMSTVVEQYNFDYHDDIGSGSLFEGSGKTYNTYKDYATDYDDFGVYISALGGSEGKSTNFNGGGSAGIVTPIFPNSWIPFSWAATVGGNFGGGSSNAETKVMMADIDGDGLPDKVFKDGKKFYYRKNLGTKFSFDVYPIKDLPNLNYSRGESSDKGFSVNIMVGNFTRSNAKSSSKTSTYMADVNADGLLDVVDNERVYFGYIDPQTKAPSYSLDSSITPVIILKEEDVAPILNPIPQVDMTNGPMDVVMVWRAPKPGQVKVTGIIAKQHIALESGVKFSIEKLHESDMGYASFVLGPNLMLSTSESHNHTLSVVKGDLLFFRVHTNQIPLAELGVSWNPKVEYTGVNPDPIQTNSRHSSSYRESFIVGTNQEHTFNKKGKYRLEWPSFSVFDDDRVTIRVSYFKKGTTAGGNVPATGNNVVIYEQTSGILTTSTFASPNRNLDMSAITSVPSSFQYVKVEVQSDSEIDWKDIDNKFKPKLVSLDPENPDVYLTPYYTNYSKVHTSNIPLQYTAIGPRVTVNINNTFSLAACTEAVCRDRYVYLVARYDNGSIIPLVSNSNPDEARGYVKFRYKFNAAGAIIQKQRLNANYTYENLGNSYSFTLSPRIGEKYFFEYYTTEHGIGELMDTYQQQVTSPPPALIKVTSSGNPSTYMAGVDASGRVKANVYTSESTTAWGPMFRNWGQFAYKGAEVAQTYRPIVGKNIHPFGNATSSGDTVGDIVSDPNLTLDQVEQDMDELERLGGNISEYFAMLLPNKKTNRWENHEHLYVSATGISPYTRFLTDDIPDLRPPTVPVGNYGAAGINKYSYVKNNSTNKSLGFGPINMGNTKSDGSSELLNEFMDINGDGFPDIIGERIQLTAKRGGLSSRIVEADFTIKTGIRGTGALLGGGYVGIRSGASSGGSTPSANSGAAKTPNLNLVVGNQGSASASGSRFSTTNTTNRFYVDINGDGLIDIVQSDGKVLLNYGGTFRESPLWRGLPFQQSITETKSGGGNGGFSAISNMDISFGLSLSASSSRDQITYLDLNGDGLPEKVVDGRYYINTGTGFEAGGYAVPGHQIQKSTEGGINGNVTICVYFPLPIIATGPKFCFSVGLAEGRNVSSEEGRYMDFDGDGYMDYVTSSRNESITVYKSRIKRTNLLKTVTQTTGATISLDYDIANPIDKSVIGSTYKMPYKKWTLTQVSVYDGFAGDGENTTKYAYEYFNGYKDRKERNFLGFGKTKAHVLNAEGVPYRTSVIEYIQEAMKDNELYQPGTSSSLKQYLYKKGLPKKTYSLDKRQRLLSETTYEYKFYDSRLVTADINTATTSSAEVSVFTEKLSVLPLVTSMQTKNWTYQAETGTDALLNQTQQKFTLYDKRGNVKKYQDVDRGLTMDIAYNLGVKTLPISHRVALTAGNQQLRLTKAVVTPNGMRYEGVSQYLSSIEFTTIKYEYDVLGNIIKKILPGGFTYTYDYGVYIHASGPGSEYTGDYFKVVPARIKDPFGNVTRNLMSVFGQPVLVRDVYGEEIRYKYDAFNRLLEVKGPYETDWTIRNKYINNRKSLTQHNLGDGNILHTSMLTDGLGRVIQVKKQLENEMDNRACPENTPAMRLAVSGKNVYDEFSRVVENYLSEEEVHCYPLQQGQTLESIMTAYYPTTDLDERKILTSYDNQDRVLEQRIFGINATTKNSYGFEGNFITQKVILPEGNTTISYFDKFGQTAKQSQLGDGQTLSTTFVYDPLGQVKQVTNAANHFTKYDYDLLGRVTKKEASASGITTFKYDDIGQLIQKKDGNGLITDYKYDFNRLINLYGFQIDASFKYEQEGRLIFMEDQTGSHSFKYGKLGEVIEDTKKIKDIQGNFRYFKTKYKYDSWGRILELIYPDTEKILYRYNEVGQLKSIRNAVGYSYLTDVKYNYFDQPYYIKYGNKVELKQEFDFTERLRAAELGLTISFDPLERSIYARNVYSYDKNNNITQMRNDFSQHENLRVGGTSIKGFSYDGFNRLSSSEGVWEGRLEQHSYSLTMKYNKDHSIAEKKQKHQVYNRNENQYYFTENALNKDYKYGDSSVPRVTLISGKDAYGTSFYQDFQYMPNGNIEAIKASANIKNAIAYSNRTFKWDANNNITAIIEDDGRLTSAYLYDGKGERVIKRIGGANSLSINGGASLNGMYGADEVLYPSGNLVYNDKYYTKHYYANAKRIASRISNSESTLNFKYEDYNTGLVSPHVTTVPRANAKASYTTRGLEDAAVPGSGRDITFPGGLTISQTSQTICKNQVDFLLNSLYNTPEKLHCRQQILAIIESSKVYLKACKRPGSSPLICLEYETVVIIDYCGVLEQINAKGCVKFTEDGLVIDPETGYIYDPETGIPLDPITREPIDLGTGGTGTEEENEEKRLELDCYNRFINFIEYFKYKADKPAEYDELMKYMICFEVKCDECLLLPGTSFTEKGCVISFCDLNIPDFEEEEEVNPRPEPYFPPVILPPGIEDGWEDTPPVSVPSEDDPLAERGPIWWYHSDHLGSTSYITDIMGKPVQYIEYLPFGEVMVEQSTNNILENVYKFNAKELDSSTGYYYYGARYYDPGASIFLSVDPLAEQFPGWNPYHYVHNNPINLIDPTGMSAQEPGDPVKQPELGNIMNTVLSEMGTVLETIIIDAKRGADKLSSDWEKNKEKSGYNHFRKGIQNWKLEGMSFTMEGGKSSPLEPPKGSRFTPWVDMTVFMIFAMDVFGPETVLPGVAPDGSNTFAPKANNQPLSPQPIVPVVPTLDKVTMKRIDYHATKPFRDNGSTFHTPVPRDTTVNRQDAPIVKELNTRDSLNGIKMRDYYNRR